MFGAGAMGSTWGCQGPRGQSGHFTATNLCPCVEVLTWS